MTIIGHPTNNHCPYSTPRWGGGVTHLKPNCRAAANPNMRLSIHAHFKMILRYTVAAILEYNNAVPDAGLHLRQYS